MPCIKWGMTLLILCGGLPLATGCSGPTNENVPTREVSAEELPQPGEMPPPPGPFSPKDLSPPTPPANAGRTE